MAFVGEVEHLAGDVEELEGVEELEAFADVEAVVELAVDDERGCFEVLGGERWRPFAERVLAVGLAVVVPGIALELPMLNQSSSVVPKADSALNMPSWETMHLKRLVWPRTQLAM